MTSDALRSAGFTMWLKFNRRSKPELLQQLPRTFGVYVVRSIRTTQRSRGESDIVYVGSACNQNGIKGRISQYFSPGPSQPTNKRILALVELSEDYEIGWCQTKLKSEALSLEQRLLEGYYTDHGERPPENKKG